MRPSTYLTSHTPESMHPPGILTPLPPYRDSTPPPQVATTSQEASREFVIAMVVKKGSPLIGQTVDKAGLRGLPQTYLVAIERETGATVNAVGPDEVVLQVRAVRGDISWASAVERVF